MNKIYEELFNLIDNSSIEKILKKLIITNDMTPKEIYFINLLIENDKKDNFLRIKYIYLLEATITFGYFADKVDDRRLFKIASAALTIYNRNLFSKILEKYEKKTIIRLEKTILKILNTITEDTINKNIELNNGEELINIQHAYLDSYKVIALAYENYTKVIQQFILFFVDILTLFLRPFFFDSKYGMLRNNLNIVFLSTYLYFIYIFLFSQSSKEKGNLLKNNEVCITDEILNVFNNLNIIVEKNKLEEELSNLLKKMLKVL